MEIGTEYLWAAVADSFPGQVHVEQEFYAAIRKGIIECRLFSLAVYVERDRVLNDRIPREALVKGIQHYLARRNAPSAEIEAYLQTFSLAGLEKSF